MMHRVALGALLGQGAVGQLLWQPLGELEKLAASGNPQAEEDVAEAFVHPTLCDPSVNQTAGYIDASSGLFSRTKYFFWLFDSKSDPANDPLIMWLSGGPGCSSQLALLAENGPCSVTTSGDGTNINPYSWHSKANVMWVDQPAGTGFSTGLGTHDEAGVAANMYVFLQGFFQQFPRFQNSDFYIFGESYAGHYVPAIGHEIWEGNKKLQRGAVTIPMKGIAMATA
jgi:cathepsin A (carboxypeptidase C)